MTPQEEWTLKNELHRTKLALYNAQRAMLEIMSRDTQKELSDLGSPPQEKSDDPPPAP